MKKTVLLILLVLPIVLLLTISIAGRIVSPILRTGVERVEFIDNYGNPYTSEHYFKVQQGGTAETKIQIYPELASNKNVSYVSGDDKICTIDENGVIHGHHFGQTTVTVKTEDGSKTATLNVDVKADVPYAVYLSSEELSLVEGATHNLSWNVDAPVAVNKRVTFTSDNPSVATVDAQGKITTHSAGVAVITVTTVSGGKTDTCTVTVADDAPTIYFDFSASDTIKLGNAESKLYSTSTNTVDILDYLVIEEGIDPERVTVQIDSASATLTDGVITFSENFSNSKIFAYVGDPQNPEIKIEITMIYIPQT